MKITVAICTWNRAELLDQTLSSLLSLRAPAGGEWELLVVNNNCTDNTDEVLARYAGRLPLRRLFEREQGQSQSRNHALREATGDLIVWTDDDVLADPGWIEAYVNAARDWPEAVFFGGTIDPWFAAPPPRWVKRHLPELFSPYAIRQFGEAIRPFSPGENPFGANMAFRTAVLKAFTFDIRLGRVGTGQVRGDETELLNRLRAAGHLGVWVGPALVKHYIPADRLGTQYIWDWFRGSGQQIARQDSFAECKWLWGAPRWAVVKYWRARLQSWCMAPFHGPRWLRAFREAALCQGIIDEARAISAGSPSPALLSSSH